MTAKWSLRAKLTAITSALVVVALLCSSGVAVMLLRGALLEELDRQLADAAGPLTTSALLAGWEDYQPSRFRPTDYYFSIWDTKARVVTHSEATTVGGSTPELPPYEELKELALDDRFVSLNSSGNFVQRWRVGVFPIRETNSPNVLGYAVVALPMTGLERTVDTTTRLLIVVGVVTVVLVVFLGLLAVQRSLKGLRRVQQAAKAVAFGDLSKRVEVETTTTEVGQLGESFNTMVAAVEKAFEEREKAGQSMRQFVADASHELRTPLASIQGYGELYRMGAVPAEEVGPTMARIESEAKRMGVLVQDLLALARLDEQPSMEKESINLHCLAADALNDLGALDPSRPTTLSAPETLHAWANRDQIRQVLANLTGNIVQHTPEGTPVEIELLEEDQWAVIKVRDHGPGVSQEDAERIFERFYRPDSSRTRASGGTGLGLAIVASIASSHGGSTYYEPTPGGGTTIVVKIPRHNPDPPTA
ncbi:MAG TPA: HAMP domain-containing sensor histidine kinase [Beutenbergiaceae bacterium]|nr:HAMP domain-containing sensor histidine kinase [Beutenbergiaceae bacterium]